MTRIRRPDPARPDASMQLLNQVFESTLDPDYRPGRRRAPLAIAVTLACIGFLIAGSATQTLQGQPAAAQERQRLIGLVTAEQTRADGLAVQAKTLGAEVRRLREGSLGSDAAATAIARELGRVELATGAGPVRGPGIRITLDDGPGGDAKSRLIDVDLRQAVNGLWFAGAEAVAINGHRLSSRTAIREAGDAVTVDYRSLTPPYRVEAVGDQATLAARFAGSAGASWLTYLKQNYGVAYDVTTSDSLTLPADPGLGVRVSRTRAR